MGITFRVSLRSTLTTLTTSYLVDQLAQHERGKQAPAHAHGARVVRPRAPAAAEQGQQVHHLQLRLGRGHVAPVPLGARPAVRITPHIVLLLRVRLLMAQQRDRRQHLLVIALRRRTTFSSVPTQNCLLVIALRQPTTVSSVPAYAA